MVNKLQRMRTRTVKLESAGPRDPRVTSKGGLALAQATAQRLRFWSDARRMLPARRDPTQGFETTTVVASLVHGLLSGGRGFSATEPMRDDLPLLAMLGLDRAPSAETVEEVVKYLAEREAQPQANALLRRVSRRAMGRGSRRELASCGGFVPVWVDGSLLEVEGKRFDSLKWRDGRRGQICVGAFVGPWLVGVDFAGEGEGEETVGRSLLADAVRDVVAPSRLWTLALILLDSLFGDGPTFDQLDAMPRRPAYIVGVKSLERAHRIMAEMPEVAWRDTGGDPGRGWSESSVGQAWLECEGWTHKRAMVCRRFKRSGEMIWSYSAVVTNLDASHPRVSRLMAERGARFEQIIWQLYSHKQAMENQWKDLLEDLGLHHPPSARASVNAMFYALAGLAYNLSVAVRRLTLSGPSRRMRLWRLRREVFDMAALVAHHARQVLVRLLDARRRLVDQLLVAMSRVARL